VVVTTLAVVVVTTLAVVVVTTLAVVVVTTLAVVAAVAARAATVTETVAASVPRAVKVPWGMTPHNTRININTDTVTASLFRRKRIMAPVTAPATTAMARKTVPVMVQVRSDSRWPYVLRGAGRDLLIRI
jgi:hypothetical protein